MFAKDLCKIKTSGNFAFAIEGAQIVQLSTNLKRHYNEIEHRWQTPILRLSISGAREFFVLVYLNT